MRRTNPSPGEEAHAREKIGRMHLERREHAEQGGEQQPGDRRSVKTSTGRRVEASISARSTCSTSLVVTSTSPNGSSVNPAGVFMNVGCAGGLGQRQIFFSAAEPAPARQNQIGRLTDRLGAIKNHGRVFVVAPHVGEKFGKAHRLTVFRGAGGWRSRRFQNRCARGRNGRDIGLRLRRGGGVALAPGCVPGTALDGFAAAAGWP